MAKKNFSSQRPPSDSIGSTPHVYQSPKATNSRLATNFQLKSRSLATVLFVFAVFGAFVGTALLIRSKAGAECQYNNGSVCDVNQIPGVSDGAKDGFDAKVELAWSLPNWGDNGYCSWPSFAKYTSQQVVDMFNQKAGGANYFGPMKAVAGAPEIDGTGGRACTFFINGHSTTDGGTSTNSIGRLLALKVTNTGTKPLAGSLFLKTGGDATLTPKWIGKDDYYRQYSAQDFAGVPYARGFVGYDTNVLDFIDTLPKVSIGGGDQSTASSAFRYTNIITISTPRLFFNELLSRGTVSGYPGVFERCVGTVCDIQPGKSFYAFVHIDGSSGGKFKLPFQMFDYTKQVWYGTGYTAELDTTLPYTSSSTSSPATKASGPQSSTSFASSSPSVDTTTPTTSTPTPIPTRTPDNPATQLTVTLPTEIVATTNLATTVYDAVAKAVNKGGGIDGHTFTITGANNNSVSLAEKDKPNFSNLTFTAQAYTVTIANKAGQTVATKSITVKKATINLCSNISEQKCKL